MKRILLLLFALLAFTVGSVTAQDDRPYGEGPVTVVTSVKVMDGQYDNYMAYLAKTYRPMMEAQKKAGLVLHWAIYDANPRNESEADLYLSVTYPNMATFDNSYEKFSPIQREVTGMNRQQAASASADRNSMRKILGSEMVREVILR